MFEMRNFAEYGYHRFYAKALPLAGSVIHIYKLYLFYIFIKA